MLLAKKDMDSLNISKLSPDQQTKIIDIKNGLELSNTGIYDYGVEISKKLGDFSSDLLSKVKVKDNPEIEELLEELMTNINSIDAESLSMKKPSLLRRIFKVDEISTFIKKHDSIVPVIETTKNKLEQCQYQLRKDIETCAMYYEENKQNIEDLDYHILAGRLKLKEEKDNYETMAKNVDKDDMLAVQELAQYQGYIDLLDRKLYNLELLRNLAIQNIPKLKILADGDNATIDKISTSISMTIPVWESQMLLAVLIARAKTATDLDKSITDMTNKLIENNSGYLRMTATQIATQIERGVIDVTSLKKSSDDIISTCRDIKTIRESAAKNRETALLELKQIQANLTTTLLMIEQNPGTTQ
jgi:uncharacterized protein YaaN involved in tellurite resistance